MKGTLYSPIIVGHGNFLEPTLTSRKLARVTLIVYLEISAVIINSMLFFSYNYYAMCWSESS